MAVLESRPVLLLEKELLKLKRLDLWGIHIDVEEDNIFKWKVTICGLRDTIWEGSRFDLLMSFPEDYNANPPSVCFLTIPIHPNVNAKSGLVCLDCLTEWKEKYSMSFVLLSLQHMLSSPSLNSPVNEEAARIFLTSPNHYKQIVLDYVLSSIRGNYRSASSADSALILNETLSDMSSNKSMKQEKEKKSNCYKLSYDEYLKLWKTIGTTESNSKNKNTPNEYVNDTSSLKQETTTSVESLEEVSKDDICMYASFNHDHHDRDKRQSKIEQLKANKIQLVKDIWANKAGSISFSVSVPKSPVPTIMEDLEIDATEVNRIISWTENLPTEL